MMTLITNGFECVAKEYDKGLELAARKPLKEQLG